MNCRNCFFYKEPECRRYAPAVSGWPTVKADDYCGEYTVKEITTPAAIRRYEYSTKGE